jgi:hypothetical protein
MSGSDEPQERGFVPSFYLQRRPGSEASLQEQATLGTVAPSGYSYIAGAGSVRISPTLPTTSAAASTRSRKCASCHEHGYFQPISAAKAYVGRWQRRAPGQLLHAQSHGPKDFLKG